MPGPFRPAQRAHARTLRSRRRAYTRPPTNWTGEAILGLTLTQAVIGTDRGVVARGLTLTATTSGLRTTFGVSALIESFNTTVRTRSPLTGTFETGVDGANITTGDAGSLSPWDDVVVGGGTLKYENSTAYNNLSAYFITSDPSWLEWDSTSFDGGIAGRHYGRVYFYLEDLSMESGVQAYLGGSLAANFVVYDSGPTVVLNVQDGDLTNAFVNVGDIPLNQWIRLEFYIQHETSTGAEDGELGYRLFYDANSVVADEQGDSGTGFATRTATDKMRFGEFSGNITSFFMDNIAAQGLTWFGAASATHLGEAARALTFTASAIGSRVAVGQAARALTFTASTIGLHTGIGQVARAITFTAASAGTRIALGSTAQTLTLNRSVAGTRTTFGVTTLTEIFNTSVTGVRIRLGSAAQTFTLNRSAIGLHIGTGQIARSIAFTASAVGLHTGTGQIARTITFSASATGARTTFGTLAMAEVFTAAVIGKSTRFASSTLALNFNTLVSPSGSPTGQVTLSFSITQAVAGQRTTYSSAARTLTLTRAVVGQRIALGSAAMTETLTRTLSGSRYTFSSTALTLTLNRTVVGQRQRLGTAALALTLNRTISGARTTFGSTNRTLTTTFDVIGQRVAAGVAQFNITHATSISGIATVAGSASLALTVLVTPQINADHYGVVSLVTSAAINIDGIEWTNPPVPDYYWYGGYVLNHEYHRGLSH